MARFFSVLSGSTPSALVADSFDQRTISDGTTKRTALIASRSIVSADVYADLDPANIDGSKGIYFPPDLSTTPNNPFSATAYTSSIPGIVIPTNYRTRPTASIFSYTAGVGPTDPLDTVSVSFTSYNNAGAAVKAVLDSITGGGPYARLGGVPSRTLHSVWHDQDLGYFAWDDFTPGTGSFSLIEFGPLCGGGLYITSSASVSASFSWIGEYSADILGKTDFHVRIARNPNNTTITSSKVELAAGNSYYDWQLSPTLFNYASGSVPSPVIVTGSLKFYDVNIESNQGLPNTQSIASAVTVQRLVTVTSGVYMATGSGIGITCYPVTQPLYVTTIDAWPGDDPANPESVLGNLVYSSIDYGGSPIGFDPGGSLPGHFAGGSYWLIFAGQNQIPDPLQDLICQYTDGVKNNASCVTAPPCYTTTTTTTTTTGPCLTYNYTEVASLTACDAGTLSSTLSTNTGFTVGSRMYEASPSTCQFGLYTTTGYIQIVSPSNPSDRWNLAINAGGYITNIFIVNC